MLWDSNVWLALALADHTHHQAVLDWLDAVSGPGIVYFCRATQQSFLRLLTTASTLIEFGNPPLTNEQAWSAYEALLTDERIAFVSEEPVGLETFWKQFSERGSASPKLWMDAYLAAFARTGGYQFVTTDKAFMQFDGLDLVLLEAT